MRSAFMIVLRIEPKSMLLNPLNVIGEPMVVLLIARNKPTRPPPKGSGQVAGSLPIHLPW
jgi:hypothetical protein